MDFNCVLDEQKSSTYRSMACTAICVLSRPVIFMNDCRYIRSRVSGFFEQFHMSCCDILPGSGGIGRSILIKYRCSLQTSVDRDVRDASRLRSHEREILRSYFLTRIVQLPLTDEKPIKISTHHYIKDDFFSILFRCLAVR